MTKPKIMWVRDIVVSSRITESELTELIEELYANPYKWAQYTEKVSSASWARYISSRYVDIQVVTRGGNNLAKSHPDKKLWTVYLRYNPKDKKEGEHETKEITPKTQ